MANDTIEVLSILVQGLPIGANLALLHFMFMLVSGALLSNQGTLFPGLNANSWSLTPRTDRQAISQRCRTSWATSRKEIRHCSFAQRFPGAQGKNSCCSLHLARLAP